MNRSPLVATVIACTALLGAAAHAQDEDLSYGYLRTVEGPARVRQASSGATVDAEANYPVLVGDLLIVEPRGRLEVSLPDFNVVRLDGDSELLLERLALSADSEDVVTALRLERGALQLLVKDLLPVEERPRVDTANARIYLQSSGVYRIATDGYGWTEVVVRQGFAELATQAGSSVVRTGEQAWIEGESWPRVGIERAGGPSDLELWGDQLDGEVVAYGDGRVESHLSYAAAPLERHGSWVYVDDDWAWRPSVGVAWRPYVSGWWNDTPLGLVWVSSEPWAWLTYHYGSWYPSPAYGWIWRPGRRFAPAWVYWYWGPSYTGWVPWGYYTGYYRHHWPYRFGFRFGHYGWAGGSWGLFGDWTFCATGNLRRRDLHRHLHRGSALARDTRRRPLERGLISTDSRRGSLGRGNREAAFRDRGAPGRPDLPDVTDFVARRRELPDEVADRVFASRRAASTRERLGGVEPTARRRAAADSLPPRRAAPGARRSETADPWRGTRVLPRPSEPRSTEAPARRRVPERRALPAPGSTAPTTRDWREQRRSTRSPEARPAAPRVLPERPEVQRRRPSEFRGRPPEPRSSPGIQRQAPRRQPVVRRVWEGIRSRSRRATPPAGARQAPARAPSRAPAIRESAPRRQPSARGRAPSPRRAPSARGSSTPSRRAPSARGSSAPSRRPPATSRSRDGSSARSGKSSGRQSSRSSGSRARGSRSKRPPEG